MGKANKWVLMCLFAVTVIQGRPLTKWDILVLFILWGVNFFVPMWWDSMNRRMGFERETEYRHLVVELDKLVEKSRMIELAEELRSKTGAS